MAIVRDLNRFSLVRLQICGLGFRNRPLYRKVRYGGNALCSAFLIARQLVYELCQLWVGDISESLDSHHIGRTSIYEGKMKRESLGWTLE